LDALRKNPSHYEKDPLRIFPGARELLVEFQEDATDIAADMSAAADDDGMDTDTDVTSVSSEDALDYILGVVIDRFGYAARDVFNAVFNNKKTRATHEAAFGMLTPMQLQEAFSFLTDNLVTSALSHMVVALTPVCSDPYTDDHWKVNFKSPWVAKSITQRLRIATDKEVLKQLSFLQRIPQAGGLEGYLFEPFIHRALTKTKNGHFQLFSMVSDGEDSPRFLMNQMVPVTIRFAKVKCRVVVFNSIADLSMHENTYYIPASTEFPLFDAFTMEIDLSKSSAILWVIQITVSRSHGGSPRGYQKIRSIMGWLKQQLRWDGQSASLPCVTVRYILVVTKGESDKLEWHFPKGWNVSCVRNDHRGDVYCIEVDLTKVF